MNHKQSPEKIRRKENDIIHAAVPFFVRQGFRETSMNDIAKKSGIGIASLYRYFPEKKILILTCGERLWEERLQEWSDIVNQKENSSLSGKELLFLLIDSYIPLYKEHPEFFLYIHFFDDYIRYEKIPQENLESYNRILLEIYSLFKKVIQKGIDDETIEPRKDYFLAYFSFSKALLGLTQKLILVGNLVSSDEEVEPEQQISTFLEFMKQSVTRKSENTNLINEV